MNASLEKHLLQMWQCTGKDETLLTLVSGRMYYVEFKI